MRWNNNPITHLTTNLNNINQVKNIKVLNVK